VSSGSPQLIASTLSSLASEWIGAVVAARAAHSELDRLGRREMYLFQQNVSDKKDAGEQLQRGVPEALAEVQQFALHLM
jgi:hypothetical protein